MFLRDLPFEANPAAAGPLRTLACGLLRTASRALDGLATRLTPTRNPLASEPVLEFHADAGAPEGALYVNGRLVGHVIGITRL